MQSSFASIAYEIRCTIPRSGFFMTGGGVPPRPPASLRSDPILRHSPASTGESRFPSGGGDRAADVRATKCPSASTLPPSRHQPIAPAAPHAPLARPPTARANVLRPPHSPRIGGRGVFFGQVSTKTPSYAIFLDTCRRFGPFSAVLRGRCPLLLHQWPILWTPVKNSCYI